MAPWSAAQSNSFDEWKAWALAEDQRTGADRWKQDDSSHLYDYRVIRRRFDELLDVRASGDAHRLLYYLNEGLHGNMGGMGVACHTADTGALLLLEALQ